MFKTNYNNADHWSSYVFIVDKQFYSDIKMIFLNRFYVILINIMRYDRIIQTNRVRIVRNIIIIHSMNELAA